VIDRRAGVLRAPNQALRYAPRKALPGGAGPKDGGARLWVLRAGKPTAIPVQTGLDDGTTTEIVKGDLQPGDELITGENSDVLEKPAAMRIAPSCHPLFDTSNKSGDRNTSDCIG